MLRVLLTILVLLFATPSLAQSLVCDIDPQSNDCIACKKEEPANEQKGICFTKALLPSVPHSPEACKINQAILSSSECNKQCETQQKSLNEPCIKCIANNTEDNNQEVSCIQNIMSTKITAENFVCPKQIKSIEPIVNQIFTVVREVLVANAKLEARLKWFEDNSDRDNCAKLLNDASTTVLSQAMVTKLDNLLSKIESCVNDKTTKIKQKSLDLPNYGLLKQYLFTVGDMKSVLETAKEKMDDAQVHKTQLDGNLENIKVICSL